MNPAHPRRWLALLALGLSLFAVGLDMTVLNTALPTLATDLHASSTDLQWFADGYNLVLAAAVLPGGLLGDRWGRRRMLTAALLVFAAGSAWCAVAASPWELIAARTVLGLGAAVLLPMSLSMITVLFEPVERQRAVATISVFQLVGIPLGLIIAGLILQHLPWGWIFAINVPLSLVALIAVRTLMPETRGPVTGRVDVPGIAISSAGLVSLSYGLIEGPQQGWASATVLGSIAAGAALLTVLVLLERRSVNPLLDLSLFRARSFTFGAVTATLIAFTMFGTMFALPQLFQAVQGADALGTGLRSLPLMGGFIAGFQLAKLTMARLGAAGTLVAGFTAIAAGSLLGTLTGIHPGFAFVAGWSAVVGLGLGLGLPTAMAVALQALAQQRAGIGSAMLLALRQFGSVLGIAALGSLLTAGYHAGLPVLPAALAPAVSSSPTAGLAVAQRLGSASLAQQVRYAFAHGLTLTLAACAVSAALGIVVSLAMRHHGTGPGQPTAPRPGRATAELSACEH